LLGTLARGAPRGYAYDTVSVRSHSTVVSGIQQLLRTVYNYVLSLHAS